jgi:hypothetical protein
VNIRFVIRGLVLALPVAAIVSVAWVLLQTPFGQAPDPTPPPPTILAPPGEMPSGPVGLREWAQYRGETYQPVGSGFLLLLDGGEVVGVTAAHSVVLGDPDHPLERIALGVTGRTGFVAAFDRLRGQPGRPRSGGDMTVDYVLLQADQPVEAGLALLPDPRAAPQPGERVSLFSGLGDGTGGSRVLEGTVQSVDATAVWVLMDTWFDPTGMSGSPLVSQHTGRVVGMAVAASPRRNRLLVGVHPIGSIVHLAGSAVEFPSIVEPGE